jgi:CelD/BcsL family acetyltransferase involved in cellulose biosynthesis
MVRIETIQDPARLGSLRGPWTGLLEHSPADGVFLTWEWLSTWWKHLSGARLLKLLCAWEGEELLAIAPFALRPAGIAGVLPLPRLELLGTGSVGSDYLDLIVRSGREQEAIEPLAAALARETVLIELDQVPHGRNAASELARQLEARGWSVLGQRTNACRYIDLSGQTWESYLAGLGRAHRSNFRRRLRHLESRHEVRFERVTGEPGRAEALRDLIALHHARWRERGFSNAFHTTGHVAFHEEFTRLAAARGWLRLFLLRLDGVPAAGLYGLRYRDVFFFYQSGFDPRFGRDSVGLVTMGLAIRSALEEGAREFDMLQGVETYKRLWARASRDLGRVEIYPPRLRGSVYRGAVRLRRAANKAVRSVLPGSVVQRLAGKRGIGSER